VLERFQEILDTLILTNRMRLLLEPISVNFLGRIQLLRTMVEEQAALIGLLALKRWELMLLENHSLSCGMPEITTKPMKNLEMSTCI